MIRIYNSICYLLFANLNEITNSFCLVPGFIRFHTRRLGHV